MSSIPSFPPPPPPAFPKPAPKQSAAASADNVSVDIKDSLGWVVHDARLGTLAKIEQGHEYFSKVRADTIAASRGNFILERELHEIDDKIKLLILNRISVQEVIASSIGLQRDVPTQRSGVLQDTRQFYEQLFYLLQCNPVYLANICRIVTPQEIPSFVQTVVFDIFGDQYDSREERLLLSLFQRVLSTEFEACTDMGSFLRANTAITQMLSAYARRGNGLAVLKETLCPPLNEICARKDLNLEINPMKVYQQYVQTYETETGKKCNLPQCDTGEDAFKLKEISDIVKSRLADLIHFCESFLARIVDGVESVPYGMRWICKQLAAMAKAKFPDVEQLGIGSLVGGYVYLRFFNPVIVTPDALNFIKEKPSKILRRNLILIAKVLQNLSNGILFGDKEEYMMSCNSFIQSNRKRILSYFEKLIEVENLEDALAVDQYLEHVQTRNQHITISFNQVCLIHSLLSKNLDVAAPNLKDPLRKIMKDLGNVPSEVKVQDNFTFGLTLSEPHHILTCGSMSGNTSLDIQQQSTHHPLYNQTKKLLYSVISTLLVPPKLTSTPLAPLRSKDSTISLLPILSSSTPPAGKSATLSTPPVNFPAIPSPVSPAANFSMTSLGNFLSESKDWAVSTSNDKLSDSITNLINMMNTLNSMGLLPPSNLIQKSYAGFLLELAKECQMRPALWESLQKKIMLVQNALVSISSHQKYLQSRLDLYKQYLDNVRKGESQSAHLPDKAKKNVKKVEPLKFSHKELEDMGIVCDVDPAIKKGVLKDCNYLFSEVESGKFKVEVIYTKGINFNVLKEPLILMLENLLKMQQSGQGALELDYVSLDVNLLIHLLNNRFIAAESRRLFS